MSRKDTPSTSARQVNELLNNLRGEHFRHEQNLRRSRATIPVVHGSGTLPVAVGDPNHLRFNADSDSSVSCQVAPAAGPSAPKSWTTPSPQTPAEREAETRTWRTLVLSDIFQRLPTGYIPTLDSGITGSRLPPLTLLCLRILLASSADEDFAQDVAPFIPAHLRRDLMRYTAIFDPLSNERLDTLCGKEGHADGELIVVGPQAVLRADCLRNPTAEREDDSDSDPDSSWDAPETTDAHALLHTLIVVSSPLSPRTLLAFPPALTHLALVKLPAPAPIFRLPSTCPFLVVLDLSYNAWLKDGVLQLVSWTRWSQLEVLVLRGGVFAKETIDRVNRERWNDVEIIS